MKPAIFLPVDLSTVEFAPSFAAGTPDPRALAAFLAHVEGTALADFFEIWRELVRRTGGIPTKREMGPHRLRRHLGHVGLTEFRPETREVVLRLAGTELVEYAGHELAGRTVNEVFERSESFVERTWLPIFEEARPRYDVGNLAKVGKAHLDYRALHLPLADDEGRVRFSIFRAIVSMDGGRSWR